MKMVILKQGTINKPKIHIKKIFCNISFYIVWNNWKILAVIQLLMKNRQQENSMLKETGEKAVLG